MKVIAQLARLFWSRGVLAPTDAQYLLDHGFARPSDFPGYHPPEEGTDAPPGFTLATDDGLDDAEAFDDEVDRQFGPERRRHAGRPKGKVPTIEDLAGSVREELKSRGDSLPELVKLARLFEPCDSWEEALPAIRRAGPSKLAAGLARGFHGGSLTLHGVWTALDPEPFHRMVEGENLRGPAVQACRILLASREEGRLGRYGWVFRLDEMQTLNNLVLAHRDLLAALRALYDASRSLDAAFASGGHPVPFWALVLLYNSLRPAGDAEPDYRLEFGPLAEPEEDVWRRAWSAALPMDPAALTALLVSCYRDDAGQEERDTAGCTRPLYCPTHWRTPDGAFRETH